MTKRRSRSQRSLEKLSLPPPPSSREAAERLLGDLAALLDEAAPADRAEAEDELRHADLDPAEIGERLEALAHSLLDGRMTASPPPSSEAQISYDPFRRGPFPVGVRSVQVVDGGRNDRTLEIEIWYPATDAFAGRDLSRSSCDHYYLLAPGMMTLPQRAVRNATPRPGKVPLVVFSHGSFAHRRQSTFLCTHLASHGYVVIAPDHAGNTAIEIARSARLSGLMTTPREQVAEIVAEIIAARVPDIRFVLDQVLCGAAGEVSRCIDPDRIGISGHSFGGWTALAATATEPRIQALLALAPGGSSDPRPGTLPLPPPSFAWGRDVPTLYLVAERDTVAPPSGMYELLARTPFTRRMLVLKDADHFHFCDFVEQAHEMFRGTPRFGEAAWIPKAMPPMSELCSGADAHLFVRGLGLAHMDAFLKDDPVAARFLALDLVAVLAQHGVRVEQATDGGERSIPGPGLVPGLLESTVAEPPVTPASR